jgi:uncharacterized membrane protein YphA (DoxX/SURF4 family)
MAVETRGTVHMRGEAGPPVMVDVRADGPHLQLAAGEERIGDWDVAAIGIQSLNDGFAIRAEGEEFVLRTEDDAGIALEIGISAASPRLARRVAASHPPEERAASETAASETAPESAKSGLGAIVFALGGVLVLAGGFFLRDDPTLDTSRRTVEAGLQPSGRYWLAFVIGGLLMGGVAVMLAARLRVARAAAVISLILLIVVFGLAAQDTTPDSDFLLAYGFVAGGIVAGVAVLFSGSVADDG